ncbi:MAG: hypothetical protein ACYDEV_13420 [Acidiferrobacter sp.]
MVLDFVHYLLSPPSLAGLGAPFAGIPTGTLVAYGLAANGLGAALFAKPIALLLPIPYRSQRGSWLFFALIATVPLFGLLAALVIATLVARMNRRERVPEPQTLAMPSFGVEMRGRHIHMGAGSTWAILRAKDTSVKRGVRALLALDPRLSRQTSSLVRAALQHQEEDLRLLAYGLLDQREGDIAAAIGKTLICIDLSTSGMGFLLSFRSFCP